MTHTRTDDEPRGRGRPRKEETQRRRKKRDGVTGQRLGVNNSKLDFDNFAYRWINDKPARIFSKTKEDDWDIVCQDGGEIKDDAETGSAIFHVTGTHPDGSPQKTYLCRKPIAYYKADRDEKMAELNRQLSEMRRGNDVTGEALADYVPHSGIQL